MRVLDLIEKLSWGIHFLQAAVAAAVFGLAIPTLAGFAAWEAYRDHTDIRTTALILGTWIEEPNLEEARPWPDESRKPASGFKRSLYDLRVARAQADRAIRHHAVLQVTDPQPLRLEFVGESAPGAAGDSIRVRFRCGDPGGSLELERATQRNPDSLSDWPVVIIGLVMCALFEWFLLRQAGQLWRERPTRGNSAEAANGGVR